LIALIINAHSFIGPVACRLLEAGQESR